MCWGRRAEITRKGFWGQFFIEDVESIFKIEYFHYFFLFFFFFFLYEGWMRRSSLLGCMLWWPGDLRMPSCIGPVASVPCGTRPIMRNPGAATLILCKRGSLALIRISVLGRCWKLEYNPRSGEQPLVVSRSYPSLPNSQG